MAIIVNKAVGYAVVNEEYLPEVVVNKAVVYGVVNEEYLPEVVVNKAVAYAVVLRARTSEGNFISFFM